MEEEIPTHQRKHSDDAQIVAEMLKEAAMPRLAASVKEAFEKENSAPVAPEGLGGEKAGKPEPHGGLPTP
jgi:hypothetical protein